MVLLRITVFGIKILPGESHRYVHWDNVASGEDK